MQEDRSNSLISIFSLIFGKEISFFCTVLLFVAYASSLQAAQIAPQRVITLSPHLAELVYALGSGDQLVGVIDHSDYPAQAKSIPRIGSATGLDMERILSLDPDLILAWDGGSRETDINKLKSLGLRVVSIKSESIHDIPLSIRVLGDLFSQQQKTDEIIQAFEKNVSQIKELYRGAVEKKVFIEISSKPLMSLTNRHSFSVGLELCGLKNIFSKINKAAIITDLESILNHKPDYVLLRSSVDKNELDNRKNFYQLSDSNQPQFIKFDEDTAFRQTPRLLNAVREVCAVVSMKK